MRIVRKPRAVGALFMGTPDASTRLFLDEIALEVRQRLKVVSVAETGHPSRAREAHAHRLFRRDSTGTASSLATNWLG